jgi:hypothetical protein
MDTAELVFGEKLRTVFQSSNHDAEYEAQMIHGLLQSAGIESIIVGDAVLRLEFQIRVPDHQVEISQSIMRSAQTPGEPSEEGAVVSGQ